MTEDLKGLNLVELYEMLEQPAAPDPVSMWPQTAGWLWLAFGLLVLGVVLFWWGRRRRRANAYRRAALAALAQAGDDPVAIAAILRRTALAGFPRDYVAGLHGADWLAFLDEVAPGVGFADSAAGQTLITAPYRAQTPNPELPAKAADWIRTHRLQEGRI